MICCEMNGLLEPGALAAGALAARLGLGAERTEDLSGGMYSHILKNIQCFDVIDFLCRFVVSIEIFGIVK